MDFKDWFLRGRTTSKLPTARSCTSTARNTISKTTCVRELSPRADSTRRFVEVVLTCNVRKVRFVRRSSASPNELILDITEQFADGRRFERHLILEKQ